ncbi:unnamed protein product, partial [Brenthis ino]
MIIVIVKVKRQSSTIFLNVENKYNISIYNNFTLTTFVSNIVKLVFLVLIHIDVFTFTRSNGEIILIGSPLQGRKQRYSFKGII